MDTAASYRSESQRCRALAAGTRDVQAADRWLRIANDYDALADAVAAEEARLRVPPVAHIPMQRQPMQQQQMKKEPEDQK